MNEPIPVEPQPAVSPKHLPPVMAADAFGHAHSPVADEESRTAEPRKSFFRGVAVGLAVMIPVWAWVVLRLLR